MHDRDFAARQIIATARGRLRIKDDRRLTASIVSRFLELHSDDWLETDAHPRKCDTPQSAVLD